MENKLYGLDLFSGIGGITKALEQWVRPITYCESDRYAQGILLSRMASGDIRKAPIWDDVRTLHERVLPCTPDIIYGGFPCQDISVAGNGKGLDGERSGLFFEIVRLAEELKPQFLFLENVPAIRTRGLARVIEELIKVGYDCRWCMLSAAEIGANHKRERWFLLAYSNSDEYRGAKPGVIGETQNLSGVNRTKDSTSRIISGASTIRTNSQHVADTDSQSKSGLSRRAQEKQSGIRTSSKQAIRNSWWAVEPNVGRVAHGIPNRLDRLKSLGNSVVPEQAKKAFEILLGVKND